MYRQRGSQADTPIILLVRPARLERATCGFVVDLLSEADPHQNLATYKLMGYGSQLGIAWVILGYFGLRRLHFAYTHDGVTPPQPPFGRLPPNAREICRVGHGGGEQFVWNPLMSRDVSPLYTQGGKRNEGVAEMRKSKLNHPPIKQEVVKRLAVGERPKSIAKDIKMSPSQVYRFASREDIKTLIEEQVKNLVEAVPDAVGNVKSLVREIKDIPKKDIKRRELSYKASQDCLKAAGIMPSQVQSQFIMNIYQASNIVLSPLLQKLLEEHEKAFME